MNTTSRLNNPFTSFNVIDSKVVTLALVSISAAIALLVNYNINLANTAYSPLSPVAQTADITSNKDQTVTLSPALTLATAATAKPVNALTLQPAQNTIQNTDATAITLQPSTSANTLQPSTNSIQLTETSFQSTQTVLR